MQNDENSKDVQQGKALENLSFHWVMISFQFTLRNDYTAIDSLSLQV